MTISRKNLRYCQVTYLSKLYDVLIAVTTLDEVDNILQEWAIDKFGATAVLNLPTALLTNRDISEVLTSLTIDEYVYLQSPVAAYMDMPRYVGISGDLPVFPQALNSLSKYVIPTAMAFLWSEPEYTGYFGEYIIPESQAFTLSAGANYIGISFNTGSPIYSLYSDFSSFDFSSIFPVVTVLSFSTGIHVIPYGQAGYGLPEKQIKLHTEKKDIDIIGDYTLTATNLYVQLSSLIANYGLAKVTCPAVDTEVTLNDMYLHYKDSSSVWQTSKVTQLDNLQYQGASGLANLVAGEYVINNIYRVVDAENLLLFTKLSNKFATLQLAINSATEKDIPAMFEGTAVLVGRVIIGQGATTSVIQVLQKNPWGVV